ncbi:MAG: acyl-CoA dehydrogenase C-terminal domain-containing protein [Burkholderiales bacterium]|nr:acyl-CoA dehydrogenase C-terminal domain-containing protein [Burkholderiales bacterium]
MSYTAPIQDMLFVMRELAGLDQLPRLRGCKDVTADVVEHILEENARFSREVLAPLNAVGDREGSRLEGEAVTTPRGFKEAYRQFAEAGWPALEGPPQYGGQGLPKLVGTAALEMWKSANLSFSLGPMLTVGATEALLLRGSDALKKKFLPNMVSGTWMGTMNLTEPQAGSDLALVKARATPEGDHYRVKGQKIFITYGEHDWSENIVHLVLARTPDAPPGVKGISLFVVPKFLVNADGSLGGRNDVQCIKLEEKLGIHASPTCVMAYGEKGGAIGYLVGEENRGLEYMFIMMNAARFAVGMEGLAISERAYQKAAAYAKERVQSRDLGGSGSQAVTIIHHPDVRRMLMSMRAATEAMRALAYVVASALDRTHRHRGEKERQKAQAFVDLMIPVVKGWFTETSIEVASLGIQVHGGMGYIEETGAAQFYRDARITTIYEGTTSIQANDLVGRKIAREAGTTAKAVIKDMKATLRALKAAEGDDFAAMARHLAAGIKAVEQCVGWIVDTYATDIKAVHAGSVPFLKLMGIVAGGWQMARAALAAQAKVATGEGDAGFLKAKIVTARFFADHYLAQAPGLRETVMAGAPGVMALPAEQF